MGKYIVQVTETRTSETIVDAGSPEEAKARGLAKVKAAMANKVKEDK